MARGTSSDAHEGQGKFYSGLTEEAVAVLNANLVLGEGTEDGLTVRDHTEKVAAAGSKSAAERLAQAEVPLWLEVIWGWFWDLKMSSPEGMGAPRISYQEIAAWATLECVELSVWQVRVLRAMDVAHIVHINKKHAKKNAAPKGKAKG